MHGTLAQAARKSTVSAERKSKFGTIVLALWPEAPASELARRAKCTKRAASFYIDGKRKFSARALNAVIAELFV